MAFDGEDILRAYIERCSNWGRWGSDDELGTLNHIGPEERIRAARLVTQGKVISLTLPYDDQGPQTGGLRSNPRNFFTATGSDHLAGGQETLRGQPANGFGYADDVLVMPNQAGTQWDALSHIFFEGRMYNDRSAAMVTSLGARANGIENYVDRIATRGVLLDLPRHLGVDSLEPGYAITTKDLEQCADAAGVEVGTGDALLIRTGFMATRRNGWQDYAGGPAPGLSLHTTPWLHEREVAAVATDTWGVEVRPNEIGVFQPFHIVALVHMGMAIGEIFDLDTLAADCAADDAYQFLFVAPPLPITGAVGSPVSALALK